jgi:hypothetical protein
MFTATFSVVMDRLLHHYCLITTYSVALLPSLLPITSIFTDTFSVVMNWLLHLQCNITSITTHYFHFITSHYYRACFHYYPLLRREIGSNEFITTYYFPPCLYMVWAMYRHVCLYMFHWTGHLESCTPGTRQYKMVCTGTSQYVPYSIQGHTRNIKMVHTSTYQNRFLPNPGRIWQNGKDMSEPCTDMLVPVQECWTCTYHVCTCLYHVHKYM